MDMTDDELWERAGRGDAGAMAELFRRHARAIYRHAFRSTADWARAEDVVSQVFLEAWRNRSRSIETGMVIAWLHGVAANVLRNDERGRSRRSRLIRRASTQRPHSS
jgi:RNA polymerase sigma-70 factor (ECF subfamily)